MFVTIMFLEKPFRGRVLESYAKQGNRQARQFTRVLMLYGCRQKKNFEYNEDEEIMVTFVMSEYRCGYVAPTLEDYVWRGNEVIAKIKRNIWSAKTVGCFFGPTNKVRLRFRMSESKEEKTVVLRFEKCFTSSLGIWERGE